MGARMPDAEVESFSHPEVEDRDGRSSIDQGSKRPVPRGAMLDAHIDCGPEDRGVAFLPIRQEVTDAVQPTPITISSVLWGTNWATAPCPAAP